ncbi:DUF4183 domain-containing protein [Neobacillus sp. MER 74]|uniref:DUF4183 domain-containing protein n=1 Tax=Bacillaceae TaxID=186817 RepID=UPI000BF568AF|nr:MULTISPECIES: DUF4183 domain-containing protein [Bacillaceae]MCM3118769.1 DUF4183 domain-containing protein [Neobacillus sp. MER 74]PFP27667.1 hypothetical protein COJ96_15740 [Bacillus sp. AFS073361]
MENKINDLTKPFLKIPIIPSEEIRYRLPKKVEVIEFYTISNGYKRIFKEEDGINEIGIKIILDPCEVSYMNLFINGVLQPKENYDVQSGVIKLNTVDVPIKGAPVILQMFIV